jgi:hypothetical protein
MNKLSDGYHVKKVEGIEKGIYFRFPIQKVMTDTWYTPMNEDEFIWYKGSYEFIGRCKKSLILRILNPLWKEHD